MLKRTITILGFKIQVMDFGYAQYFYPEFNGNAEFKVSSKGFKEMCHYLRTVLWSDRMMKEMGLPTTRVVINLLNNMPLSIK